MASAANSIHHAQNVLDNYFREGMGQITEERFRALKAQLDPLFCTGIQNDDLNLQKSLYNMAAVVWNSCISADEPTSRPARWQVEACLYASNVMTSIPEKQLTEQEKLQIPTMLHATGREFAANEEHEAAEACFAEAMRYVHILEKQLEHNDTDPASRYDATATLLDLYLDRAKTALHLNQKPLATEMYSNADAVLESPLSEGQLCDLRLHLVEEKTEEAEKLLEQHNPDALALLNSTLDHCVKLESVVGGPAMVDMQVAVREQHAKILRMLAWGYTSIEINGQRALNCIVHVRQLDQSGDDAVIGYVALKAYIELKKYPEARAEFIGLLAASDAPLAIYLQAIMAIVQIPGGITSVQEVARDVMERFPTEISILVHIVKCLIDLGPSRDKSSLASDADEAVLRILADETCTTIKLLFTSNENHVREQRDAIYLLVWNRGTLYFKGGDYEKSTRLYAAAFQYANDEMKPKVGRFCALAYVGLRQYERAHDYLNLAEERNPECHFIHFTRFKVYLEQHDIDKAAQQLKRMINLPDCDIHILRVACQEALIGKAYPVAKEALLALHARFMADPAEHKESPGQEAVILRCLIDVTVQEGVRSSVKAQDYSRLAQLYSLALDRARAQDFSTFFGGTPEVEYFAQHAWNLAKMASDAQDMEACMTLFQASAGFYGLHNNKGQPQLRSQKMAYLMAAACAVEACKEGSKNVNAINAARMSLAECKRVSIELAALCTTFSYDKSDVFRLIKEFELAVAINDPAEQMRVLGECKTMPLFKPEHFVTLGQSSSNCGDSTAIPAGVSAFQTALERIQDSAPLPEGMLGHVLVELIRHSTTDEEKLGIYTRIPALFKSCHSQSIADTDRLWLVTACWNRGATHSKFHRKELSLKFMNAALAILPDCKDLKGKAEGLRKHFEEYAKAGTSEA